MELHERVQKALKKRISELKGETVLPDYQLEKIAEMVLKKLGEAILKAKNEK